jgi:DNA anti-recombination protein RmuC
MLRGKFSMEEIPDLVISESSVSQKYYELLNPINFKRKAEQVVRSINENKENKLQMQMELENEIKKIKRERRSTSSVTVARELDDIGHMLQEQLHEIERYVQKRSTDRELIKNVRKMLNNINNLYKVEVSRIIID